MTDDLKFFIIWVFGLIVCWAIELSVQQLNNIVGFGIIGAIFLSVLFMGDLLTLMQNGRRRKR